MKILPGFTKETFTKDRVLELVRWGIYLCCFVGMILHLNAHENVLYEVQKGLHRDIVFIFFFIFLFTLQKIKLINWQSALVSGVFLPVCVFRILSYAGSAELFQTSVLDHIVYWMALMLITDMVVSGRVRSLKKANVALFAFLCFLTAWLIYNREGRAVPFFYLYCILLCLIPVSEKEWNRVIDALVAAGFVSLIVVIIVSEGVNPVEASLAGGERWYAYFLTLGTFGQFIGLETVLAVVALFRIKSRYQNSLILYFICGVWLLLNAVLALLCGALNYFVGLTLFLAVLFVFGFRKTRFPWLVIRALIATSVLLMAGILILDVIPVIVSPDYDADAVMRIIGYTPLRFFPGGAQEVVAKMESLHTYRQANYNFVSDSTAFQNNPIMVFLDMLGSGRASIWNVFLANTSFEPNSGGLYIGTFFVLHAHNEFIQLMFEYGFFVGGMNILFFIIGWIVVVIRYVKDKKEIFLLPLLMIPMMLGMWVGETSSVFYQLTGISLICLMTVVLFGIPDKTGEELKGA